MSLPAQRALRFVHPAFGGGAAGLRVAVTGRLETVDAPESIRQALRLLLTTEPGERIMRPGYGCALGQLMFAPNDETTAGLAIHFVRRAVETWEPRVEIVAVDAVADAAAPGRLDIVLEYRLRRLGAGAAAERLVMPISLTGERAR